MFVYFKETYPHTPPVWFADSEDISITGSVERLSQTSGLENHVISQIGILVRELCKAQGLPEPTSDLEKLSTAMTAAECSAADSSTSNSNSSKSASNGSSEDMDIEYEFDDDEDDDDDDNGI